MPQEEFDYVVIGGGTAGREVAISQTSAAGFFEQVEDALAFADAVEDHRSDGHGERLSQGHEAQEDERRLVRRTQLGGAGHRAARNDERQRVTIGGERRIDDDGRCRAVARGRRQGRNRDPAFARQYIC